MEKETKVGDSNVQRQIEKIVFDHITIQLGMQFESGVLNVNDSGFQVDFFNKEEKIYGEIYAGIDSLKPGQIRKVGMDILKLLTIEKMIGEQIKKYVAFVDPTIERKFKSSSWYSKSLDIFEIEIITITLTQDQITLIRDTKKNQYR